MAVKITLSIATGRKHYDDEGSELSVLTCKAITREISSLPGVSDNNRADSWRRRRTGILMMTALIHGTEERDSALGLTCKAITWEISPLPGVSDAELIHDPEDDLGG